MFSDTSRLKELIRERSTVLENLEVAETYYIQSFQLPTSVAGTEDDTLESEGRNSGPSISRPLPLGKKRRVNQLGPGEHGGPTPTTYVAPPQYYKLKHVNVCKTSALFYTNANKVPKNRRGLPVVALLPRQIVLPFASVNASLEAVFKKLRASRSLLDACRLVPKYE